MLWLTEPCKPVVIRTVKAIALDMSILRDIGKGPCKLRLHQIQSVVRDNLARPLQSVKQDLDFPEVAVT